MLNVTPITLTTSEYCCHNANFFIQGGKEKMGYRYPSVKTGMRLSTLAVEGNNLFIYFLQNALNVKVMFAYF